MSKTVLTFGQKMNTARRLREMEIHAWESGRLSREDAVQETYGRAITFYERLWPEDEMGMLDLLLSQREKRLYAARRRS